MRSVLLAASLLASVMALAACKAQHDTPAPARSSEPDAAAMCANAAARYAKHVEDHRAGRYEPLLPPPVRPGMGEEGTMGNPGTRARRPGEPPPLEDRLTDILRSYVAAFDPEGKAMPPRPGASAEDFARTSCEHDVRTLHAESAPALECLTKCWQAEQYREAARCTSSCVRDDPTLLASKRKERLDNEAAGSAYAATWQNAPFFGHDGFLLLEPNRAYQYDVELPLGFEEHDTHAHSWHVYKVVHGFAKPANVGVGVWPNVATAVDPGDTSGWLGKGRPSGRTRAIESRTQSGTRHTILSRRDDEVCAEVADVTPDGLAASGCVACVSLLEVESQRREDIQKGLVRICSTLSLRPVDPKSVVHRPDDD